MAPMAAENLIKEMLKKLSIIKENPNIRPLVRNEYLSSLGYRSINVKNYMIWVYLFIKHKMTVTFWYQCDLGSKFSTNGHEQ